MLMCEYARRRKQMTQRQLSAATRIAAHFISLVENKRGIPNGDQSDRLALVLDLPVDQLLIEVPSPKVLEVLSVPVPDDPAPVR